MPQGANVHKHIDEISFSGAAEVIDGRVNVTTILAGGKYAAEGEVAEPYGSSTRPIKCSIRTKVEERSRSLRVIHPNSISRSLADLVSASLASCGSGDGAVPRWLGFTDIYRDL